MPPSPPLFDPHSKRGTALSVSHLSSLPRDRPGREAIAAALEIVHRELDPLAVSFFELAGSSIRSSVVYGSGLAPRELVRRVRAWKLRLRGREPLAPARIARVPDPVLATGDLQRGRGAASGCGWLRRTYREIGAVNDVRLPIRDGDRLVAGVTVWRRFGSPPWTAEALRRLRELQPLLERAYTSSLQPRPSLAGTLPQTLTRRQREVAELLAAGATNADVARALQISPNTAKSHTRKVFAALGINSRREVALRFAGRADAAPAVPQGEAADPALALLTLTMGWAEERIGAALGGCVLVSPRGEPVAEAWAGEAELAARVHELVLEPPDAPAVLRAAACAPASAARLDALVGEAAQRALRLLRAHGLTAPTLVPLRRRGRLAGLIWLSREARSPVAQAASESLLRAVQPLLEASLADAGATAAPRAASLELTNRGLSARQLTVARLALGGADNASIAAHLGIAEATVKKHMTRILAKCQVRSRADLIAMVAEHPATLGDHQGVSSAGRRYHQRVIGGQRPQSHPLGCRTD